MSNFAQVFCEMPWDLIAFTIRSFHTGLWKKCPMIYANRALKNR